MKRIFNSTTISVGLAIFSMLFGAGNLVYPVVVGLTSGDQHVIGILGFLLTAVCLPVIGLIASIFFNGNYDHFFGRLGNIPGKTFLFLCIMIIGPILGIPRIVTLSHTMTAPFLPEPLNEINLLTSFFFSILFLLLTFLGTFRESKIVNVLGHFISPVLLVSLLIIIIKGIFTAESTFSNPESPLITFKENLKLGYATLDLLGTIFFSYIVLHAIARNTKKEHISHGEQALIGLKSGLIGASLLALVYIGLNYISAYHGQGLIYANPGELFREVSFKILTRHGAIIISLAVFMACYSTIISLAAVLASYLQRDIFKKKISYITALILGLVLCLPLSIAGLSTVLKLAVGPITYLGYPTLIALTFCNLAYKLWNFKPVKVPVLATFVTMLIVYIYQYL